MEIIINDKNHIFSCILPDYVQDFTLLSDVTIKQFLENEDNFLIKIEDQFFPVNKYFLNDPDEITIFDSGEMNHWELFNSKPGLSKELINCERFYVKIIGKEYCGVLVKKEIFIPMIMSGSKVVELFIENIDESTPILQACSKNLC